MKMVVVALCTLLMISTASAAESNISFEALAKKPDVFCHVNQLPNPVFFDGWQVTTDDGQIVEFHLVQVINQYGCFLYFQNDKEFKDPPHAKWRDMIIFGDVIATPSRNISFSATKDGKIFYRFRGGKQYEMTRVKKDPNPKETVKQ